MAKGSELPSVEDPDRVPEIFCEGQINVSVRGQNATLTFAHFRPDATALFEGKEPKLEAVVRARISSLPNLIALRDLLNGMIQDGGTEATATSGPTKH